MGNLTEVKKQRKWRGQFLQCEKVKSKKKKHFIYINIYHIIWAIIGISDRGSNFKNLIFFKLSILYVVKPQINQRLYWLLQLVVNL